MYFKCTLAPSIIFGGGSSLRAGEVLTEFGCKKVMCIYDKGIKSLGLADPIIKAINDAGIEVISYAGVLPDPPDYTVEEAAELAKKEKVDGLVAIGGGSSIDTAKAANVLIKNDDKILNEYDMNFFTANNWGLPLVTIPTTAGTGSEVSGGAIITNTKTGQEAKVGQKMSLFEKATTAVYALVDPDLMLGLPRRITVSTALDALCHCVEASTTEFSTLFLDPLCYQGIALIKENLPKVLENPKDEDARGKISLAAMIGGFVAGNAYAQLAHGIGQGLQGVFHMEHGTGCAVGLQMAVESVAEAFPDKVKMIGQSMGVDVKNLPPKEAAAMVSKEIGEFLKFVGTPTLKEMGIEKSKLESAIPYITTEAAYIFSYIHPEGEEIMEYLLRVYESWV